MLNYANASEVRVVQFRDALRELGYVEGQDLILKERDADGALNRLRPECQAVVTSLARPSGNLTGFLHMSSDLAAKRFALRDFLKMHSSRRALRPTRTCDGGGAYRDQGRRAQPWRDAGGHCGAQPDRSGGGI